MRIAFIDPFPQKSTNSWVQTVQFLKEGFREKGAELFIIEDIKLKPSVTDRLKKLQYMAIGEKYLFEREPELLKRIGSQIDQRLEHEAIDIIFCPSSLPLAYVKNEAPKVVWTDSTFGGLVDLYEPFSNVCKRSMHNGHLTERDSMLNADLTIYSSEWAAAFASENYRISRNSIDTIPLGANLKQVPERDEVERNIAKKGNYSVDLLFVGYDWERKGGAHAVRTHQLLRAHGLQSRLTVVGCNPLIVGDVTGIRVLGKLDKKNPQEAAQFREIMLSSHLLLLPSQADCTAIVFSESAAYGLPVISTDVGGHKSIIADGENGFLFPPEDPAPQMTERILNLIQSPAEYQRVALNARNVFDERLSWDAGITKAMFLFEGLIDPRVRLSRAV